jgi:hypothetical protein
LAQKQIERCLKIIIVLATIVLVGLCILLVREYHHLRRLDYVAAHRSLFEALRAHSTVQASDADVVASWMTFDYVNHLFALPPNYLQTQLAITDSRYPRLTIAEYADELRLGQSAFLTHVQDAVRAYFAQKQ